MATRRNRPAISRDELVQRLREVACEVRDDDRLSFRMFNRLTGISQSQVERACGSWVELRESAGMMPFARPPRQYTDEDLLQEFHRLAVKLKRLPTLCEFNRHARMSSQPLRSRFGRQDEVYGRYRLWLARRERKAAEAQAAAERRRPPAEPPHVMNPTQPRMLSDQQRDIRWMQKTWFRLRVGFELLSSHFRGRRPDSCDVLVVLNHDWPACPVKVLELAAVTPERPPRGEIEPA